MKKILILGGGLSGLAAGIRALELGYIPTIIEKNEYAGGLCTSYVRNGSINDLCIHYLLGIGNEPMKEIYKHFGCLNKASIIKLPYLFRFYYFDKTITVSRDLNQFKNELLSYAVKEDIKEVKRFIKYIKNMEYFPMIAKKSTEIMTRFEYILTGMSYLKHMPSYSKISRVSIEEYANRFKSDILKSFILSFMPKSFSVVYLIGLIAKFVTGNADILNISSKDFSYNVLDKYLSLGGKILYNEEVLKLEYNDNKISKVITKNNSFTDFDFVINAMPLNYFYNNILDEKYRTDLVYKEINDLDNNKILSSFIVFFKVKKEYSHQIPHYFILNNKNNIDVAGNINPSIGFRSYDYIHNSDNTITISAIVDQDYKNYSFWEDLKNKSTYEQYKNDKAKELILMLEERFSFLHGLILVSDIITPLSFNKWGNVLYGGYLSNLSTKTSTRGIFEVKSSYVSNLYHAGQMVYMIGGIVGALINGKFAVEVIDYHNKKSR